jgi:hypothetical protein
MRFIIMRGGDVDAKAHCERACVCLPELCWKLSRAICTPQNSLHCRKRPCLRGERCEVCEGLPCICAADTSTLYAVGDDRSDPISTAIG